MSGKILLLFISWRRCWQWLDWYIYLGAILKDGDELIYHIQIRCYVLNRLWNFLLAIFGVKWLFNDRMENLFVEWNIKILDKRQRKVCSVDSCFCWYSIERGLKVFWMRKTYQFNDWTRSLLTPYSRRSSLNPYLCSLVCCWKCRITHCWIF